MDKVLTTLKIIIIGESGVGKSSLLLRFIDGNFSEDEPITIGVEFRAKVVTVNNNTVKLSIWDTAGQEKFRSIAPNYFRDAHGAILIYDVSNRMTFNKIEDWMNELDTHSSKPNIVKMIVGNKIDLDTREISKEEGIKLARRYNTLFVESSAKTDDNVEVAFLDLVSQIIETPELWESTPNDNIILKDSNGSRGNCMNFKCSMI